MKSVKRAKVAGLSAWLLLLVSTLAMAAPFVGSRNEPHAVLYLNENQTARQIWPVKIWAVDGKLTNRSNQGVLWVKPGEYSFDFKLGKVNLADVPGLSRNAVYGQKTHVLKLKLEAGKAYYIGAKVLASGDWQPTVWKVEQSKY
ncbi:MAG: hypothetical protein KGL13_04815 [Gammaproteobacteria bacterium]|nr:hypothetical protein [Gammaproteobacteria bacterium]MDE2345771.1 hypothetical protein [Gammaproteobacteria bacterium]